MHIQKSITIYGREEGLPCALLIFLLISKYILFENVTFQRCNLQFKKKIQELFYENCCLKKICLVAKKINSLIIHAQVIRSKLYMHLEMVTWFKM